MGREKLTVPRIKKYECAPGKSQSIFWDTMASNLGVRVTKAHKKSYVFESSLHGKTIRITLGSVSDMTIDGARAEALELKSLINKGLDPRLVRRESANAQEAKAKAEISAENLKRLKVADAWSDYLASHTSKWSERHLRDHLNLSQAGGENKKIGKGKTVQGVLSPLLSIRMSEISSALLIEWVRAEAPKRANNTRQGFEAFRAFWRWCASREAYQEVVDAQIVESKELREEVPKRQAKRFDVLERSQLGLWFDSVLLINNPVQRAYLQALILTGARREEMASLRWCDVELQWSSLWVKDKVAAEGRKIPLTPYLESVITSLPRRNEWVFSSPVSKSGRITEPRISHNRALDHAGLNHVTLHGLRRTFASLAEWVEMPSGVVAQIMGHAPNATAEKHYINRPLELLAVWHTKYEKWILEQSGIDFNYDDHSEGLKVVS